MAAIGAIGAIVSGVMGMAQANYQAKVANMNAEIAKDNAKRAIERSQVEAKDQDALTREMIGEQVAAQGASGLSLTGGSAMKTRAAARRLGRRDTLNVRQAGELEAYQYKTDAMNYKAQAAATKAGGITGLLGSFFQAAESMVGQSSSTGAAQPSFMQTRRKHKFGNAI